MYLSSLTKCHKISFWAFEQLDLFSEQGSFAFFTYTMTGYNPTASSSPCCSGLSSPIFSHRPQARSAPPSSRVGIDSRISTSTQLSEQEIKIAKIQHLASVIDDVLRMLDDKEDDFLWTSWFTIEIQLHLLSAPLQWQPWLTDVMQQHPLLSADECCTKSWTYCIVHNRLLYQCYSTTTL